MPPKYWIDQLVFSDGTTVPLASGDIVVIVGPNNCGKSAALRGIRDRISQSQLPSPVIPSLHTTRAGTAQDFLEWVPTFARLVTSGQVPYYEAYGVQIAAQGIDHHWTKPQFFGSVARFFCHLLTADERLSVSISPPSIAVLHQGPSHPIHHLLLDDGLEEKLSKRFRKAFGVDLIVHRAAGNVVPLLVGERPTPEPGQDRISRAYLNRLEALPQLQFQGDGMRSFAGVLLHTTVGRESILLIDEPEAFLHPPQARQLGRLLVTDKPTERQLIVATHSGDVLRGVLDTNNRAVRVLRIRREGNINIVNQLDNAKIESIWRDPLLRHSNILDGLFHERVVICESDSDARFYAAMMDSMIAGNDDAIRPDIMFVHTGGKDRLATVLRALHQVAVPARIVADFDLLRNERPLSDIVKASGAEWEPMRADWTQVKAAIEAKKPDLTTTQVIEELQKILENVAEPMFPDQAKDAIAKVLRRSSPWANAKDGGIAFVPPGTATQACRRLLEALATAGIHIVPVGELEGFARSIGGHGPRWVNEVLNKDLARDPELEGARAFVSKLYS